MVNYLEWTNVTEEGNNIPNVEKILTAQLIIESPKGDAAPDKIVAIINPMTEVPNTERSLTSLAGITHDCKTATTSGNFLMSNSTYAKDNVKQMAVSLTDKIKKTSGEALNDPVEIYVERAVAKVRLNSSLTPLDGTTNIYKTSADGSQKVTLDENAGERKSMSSSSAGTPPPFPTNLVLLKKSIRDGPSLCSVPVLLRGTGRITAVAFGQSMQTM